ncbi:hypothetical protein DPMN_026259 [Dreissena polymorpha]|uniref:Alpha-carbonic anhydrase domain-containing protein n=1 Tax=Dreissena polymorpha TaxID=45954 RepID=A0A9D4RDB4_DREPO|nr:hypothetical protein DPMN_026259 [Dreissena polymorpha]
MHIVHYNKKYANFSSSIDKTDGLAVLGFFFEVINNFLNQLMNRTMNIKVFRGD